MGLLSPLTQKYCQYILNNVPVVQTVQHGTSHGNKMGLIPANV